MSTRAERRARKQRYVPDELLVRFRPGVAESDVRAAHAQVGGRVLRTIPRIGVQVVKLPPGVDPEAALAAYRSSPWVQSVERNAYVYAAATPNDPLFSTHQWHYPAIGLPSAWDVTKGSPVIVAVVDTGVRFDHPDLVGLSVPGWDFVDDDPDATDPGCPAVDPGEPSHGTHVAATIAALTDNGVGVAGVSWGGVTGVRLMSLRVLGEDVSSGECGVGTLAAVASAVAFAADHGAKVINLSLSGDSPSFTLQAAVDYAYGRGVVLVAAAGNDGGPVAYPAAYPNVIAVVATACDNSRASYSNFGSSVDLAAPGGAATAACPAGSPLGWVWSASWSPVDGHGYWGFRGTSMAAPHVSGVAALLVGRGLTSPQQVKQRLEQTATDLGASGWDPFYGWGLVNAAAAVGAYEPARVMRAFAGIVTGTGVVRQSHVVAVAGSGAFTVTGVQAGVRSVMAWQDFNGNGVLDVEDLWGRVDGVVVNAGQTTTGVVVPVRRYTGPALPVTTP
jgi:serine protease